MTETQPTANTDPAITGGTSTAPAAAAGSPAQEQTQQTVTPDWLHVEKYGTGADAVTKQAQAYNSAVKEMERARQAEQSLKAELEYAKAYGSGMLPNNGVQAPIAPAYGGVPVAPQSGITDAQRQALEAQFGGLPAEQVLAIGQIVEAVVAPRLTPMLEQAMDARVTAVKSNLRATDTLFQHYEPHFDAFMRNVPVQQRADPRVVEQARSWAYQQAMPSIVQALQIRPVATTAVPEAPTATPAPAVGAAPAAASAKPFVDTVYTGASAWGIPATHIDNTYGGNQ